MTNSLPSSNLRLDNNWHVYDWHDIEDQMMDYHPGGMHPVNMGDVFESRYTIVHHLGCGGLATIWMAKDTVSDKLVALKILRAGVQATEYEVAKKLVDSFGSRFFSAPLGTFTINGPNGMHEVIVMELARESLYEVMQCAYDESGPGTLGMARSIVRQLLMAVGKLHDAGIVHFDLHAGNILFKLPEDLQRVSTEQLYERYGCPVGRPLDSFDQLAVDNNPPSHLLMPICFRKSAEPVPEDQAEIVLADFGEAFQPAMEDRYDSNTPRIGLPPEYYFRANDPLSFSADIWALGVMIFEIVSCMPAFAVAYCDNNETIAEHIEKLGPLPAEWWDTWEERSDYFNEDLTKKSGEIWETLENRFHEGMQTARGSRNFEIMSVEESEAFFKTIKGMFAYKPEERLTIHEVLETDWVRNWILPSQATPAESTPVMEISLTSETAEIDTPVVDVAPIEHSVVKQELSNRELERTPSPEPDSVFDHESTTDSCSSDDESSQKRSLTFAVPTLGLESPRSSVARKRSPSPCPIRVKQAIKETHFDFIKEYKPREVRSSRILDLLAIKDFEWKAKNRLQKCNPEVDSSMTTRQRRKVKQQSFFNERKQKASFLSQQVEKLRKKVRRNSHWKDHPAETGGKRTSIKLFGIKFS